KRWLRALVLGVAISVPAVFLFSAKPALAVSGCDWWSNAHVHCSNGGDFWVDPTDSIGVSAVVLRNPGTNGYLVFSDSANSGKYDSANFTTDFNHWQQGAKVSVGSSGNIKN